MPDPLHPALVHLPIALATLIPILGILAILSIRWKFLPARCWSIVVLLQALLLGSAWAAAETGEDQEDRVERVVAERYIETHEESAERFLVACALALAPIALGLLPGRNGSIARTAGVIAAGVVLAAGVSVGQSGGALVYEHGAANAYLERGAQDR